MREEKLPHYFGEKLVGHLATKVKEVGMRWAKSSLNPMLVLRTAVCNKTWDTNWQTIRAHYCHTRQQQQRLNRLKSPD